MIVTDTLFGRELANLVDQYVQDGADPGEIATEMQRQLNVLTGQHNLEFELIRPTMRKAA